MSKPDGDWILDGLGGSADLPLPGGEQEPPRPEEALELPEDEELRFEAPDAAALLRQARFWLDLDRPKDALKPLQELTDWYPEDAEAWCEVARAFHLRDDKARALRAAELAIKGDPYSAGGYAWKCRVLLHHRDPEEALAAAQTGSEMTYQEWEIERWVVRAQIGGGEQAEALRYLTQLEATGEDAETAYLHGELALLKPNLPAAEAEFRRAVQAAPGHSEAWGGLAEVLRKQNRPDEALSCMAKAVRLEPGRQELGGRTLAVVNAVLDSRLTGRAWYGVTAMLASLFCNPGLSTLILFPAGLCWYLYHRRRYARRREQALLELPGDLVERYRAARAQDSRSTRWVLGLLLTVIGGCVLFTLLQPRLGTDGLLRLGALAVLLGPPLGWWLSDKTQKPPELRFRFPGDPYVPEDPEAADPTPAPPPDWEPNPLGAGWMLLYEGEPAAAQEQARSILKGDPEQAAALALFSAAALLLSEHESGLAAAKSARAHELDNERAHALVWAHLTATGRLEEAVAQAKEDRAIADGVGHFLVEQTRLQFHHGSAATARALSQLVQRLYPGSSEPHEVEGEWAYAARRWAESEAAFRRALTLDPASASLHADLAWTLERRGRFGAACVESRRALTLDAHEKNARALLERQATFQAGAWPVLLSLIAGLAVAAPTFLGSPKNDGVLIVTLCGPLLAAAAAFRLQKPVLRRIAPGLLLELHSSGTMDPWMTAVSTGGTVLLLQLTLHTFQAWLEVGLHPALLPARWPGAVTVTAWAAAIWLAAGKLFLDIRRSI